MNKRFSTLALGAFLSCNAALAWEGNVVVNSKTATIVMNASEGGALKMQYFGDKLTAEQAQQMVSTGIGLNTDAYPSFGQTDMTALDAIQVLHADGNWTLYPTVDNVSTSKDGNATITTITMSDKKYPVTVKLFYKAYDNVGIIETWTEISHKEKKAITLKRYDSGHFAVNRGDVWITHMHGNWASEQYPVNEPLTMGVKTIRNSDGARNAHCDAPEIMISLDGKAQENSGRVIGAALCWNGNYDIRVNSADNKTHHIYAGIDPQTTEYTLEPKETFTTPTLALSYSKEGMSGVSRNFHYWARHCGWMNQGDKVRDILLNSWEGVVFNINEQGMFDMMKDIKDMGGELFVMDDGWFGDKYQRNNDSTTLGDWTVDKKKLPNGIAALTKEANRLGLHFGIWIEPESTNTQSEFYEKHPDWVLQEKNRDLKMGRGGTQLLLDMCNPKVQDFVYNIVDNLMTENPDIAYIKWDANASLTNFGSNYLPANKQSHLYIEYHRGLTKVLQRIRAKYPTLTIQDCSSGGGRVNYGLLPYFEEVWTSDNNDPYQRVFIQWSTSYFFPSNAMGQHIAAGYYWTTGRQTPIKYRCDVAMSGRLGMELQPKHMTDEERKQCTACIADYKRNRELIQLGNLYRLVSPYDNRGIASLMYTNDDKSRAILFGYRVQYLYNIPVERVKMVGLDPLKNYRFKEINVMVGQEKPSSLDGKVISGKLLMETGVDLALEKDYASCVYEVTAE